MLISAAEKTTLSGNFLEVFDAFSRTVIIHKEALKTQVDNFNPDNGVFGLGESQQSPIYTYTPVNKAFPAVVRYKHNINDPTKTELDAFFARGGISIMVQRDCYDYIMTNKTEKIEIDERAWFVVGVPRAKKFLSNDYYVFYLQNL